MTEKKSFRVELEPELHHKLHRLAMDKNVSGAEFIRDALRAMPDRPTNSVPWFSKCNSRLFDKLEFWAGKRLFRYQGGDYWAEARVEISKEVSQYVNEIIFVSSLSQLDTALQRWNKRLSYQEKAAIGSFFPFCLKAGFTKDACAFFTESDWYSLKEGEYIVLKEAEIDGFSYNGVTSGIITENSYRAHILNAPEMMIVDVDTDYSEDGSLDSVIAFNESVALTALNVYQDQHPDSSFRVYRTAKGLRYIRTDCKTDPKRSWLAMRQLLADPKYRRLCEFQETFRARLTPKPWRTDSPNCWQAVDQLEEWSEYQVCQYITTVGDRSKIIDEFKPMIEYHDRWTRALDKSDSLILA